MIHWPEIVPEKLRASVCSGLHAGKVTLYARKWSVSPEVAGPAIVHQEAGHGLMGGGKLALAIVGGYLLGRTKRMKLAIMLGGALAGKKISTDPAALLGQATKLVNASPELQKLDAAVRGRLLEAGKDADLLVLRRDSLEIVEVIARGRRMVRGGDLDIREKVVETSSREFHLVGEK